MDNQLQQQKVFAVILMLFLFFVWSQNTLNPFLEYLTLGPEKIAQAKAAKEAASNKSADAPAADNSSVSKNVRKDNQPASANDSEPYVREGSPTDEELAAKGFVTIENDKSEIQLSLLGARVKSIKLKEYSESVEDKDTKLELVDHTDATPYSLGVYSGDVNDGWAEYIVSETKGFSGDQERGFKVSADKGIIVLSGTLPDWRTIQKKISIRKNDFRIDVEVEINAPTPSGKKLELEIAKFIPTTSSTYADLNSGYAFFGEGKLNKKTFKETPSEAEKLGPQFWTAISEKYFTDVLIARENSESNLFQTENVFFARATGGAQSGKFSVYSGPKDYRLLTDIGDELHRTVDFGWTAFVSVPLMTALHALFGVFGNYGVAIVVLTILVKLALYPLTAAQFKSMKAMQELQPEMKRIREQVSDRQEQQMQLMALYKKRGVNPLGGCFPLLLQMPIFIGLYFGLQASFALRHQPFAYWITDLSAAESLDIAGIGVPVMIILMVIAMYFQQLTTPTAMDPQQKRIMMMMPLLMGVFFIVWGFPAGLTLYWLTNSLISIGQQKGMQSELKISALQLTLLVSAVTFTIAIAMASLGN